MIADHSTSKKSFHLNKLLGLLLGFTVIILLMHLSLKIVGNVPDEDTFFKHAKRFLKFQQSKDSWFPMISAIQWFLQNSKQSIYQVIFFQEGVKFQYPPTSLVPFYLFDKIHILNYQLLKVISWLSIIATTIFAHQIYRHTLCQFDEILSIRKNSHWRTVLELLAFLGLTLTFYPVMKAYSLGQIQAWITCCFAASLLAWLKQKYLLSGLLLGLTCLIKPQYAVFIVWGLLRCQWRFSLGFLAIAAIGSLISLAIFGWANHIDYLQVLSFLSKHGEAFYPNQSFNGLLQRLLMNGDNLEWNDHKFPPFHPFIYAGTLLSSILLLAIAFWPRPLKTPLQKAIDLCVMALVATMASPIAWEHHYGLLLPIYACVIPALLITALQQKRGAIAIALLFVIYCMTTFNWFFIFNQFANQIPLNILQSYLYLGAIGLLILLIRWFELPVFSLHFLRHS